MKKLVSIVLSVVLAATCVAFTASADDNGYVALFVREGRCELVDNTETNYMAKDKPAKLMASHGIGYTTQGDSVMWSDVVIKKKATTVVVKGGYNIPSKPGTGTEFWVYLNKIDGEPIAKISVNDTETAGSDIPNQIYKTATVDVEPGTYTVFLVGETENSGSFSEVGFVYEGYTFGGNWESVTSDNPEVPAEEPDEEPAEEPDEEPAEEPDEEPAEEPDEEPAEEPDEEPAEEPTEETPADAEVPAEAANFPVVPVVIAVIVLAAIIIAIVASKKKKA